MEILVLKVFPFPKRFFNVDVGAGLNPARLLLTKTG